MPGGDRADRAIVRGSAEDPLPLRAHVLAAEAVHAAQDDGPALAIDQPVPRYMEPGWRAAGCPVRARCRRQEQE